MLKTKRNNLSTITTNYNNNAFILSKYKYPKLPSNRGGGYKYTEI